MLTRRLSLLLSGLVCSSFAHAGEGFYVGAGASYNWLDYDFNAVDRVTPSGALLNSEESTAEGNSAGGQVLAGYTWLIPSNNLYFFSIEAFADFYSTTAEQSWPDVTPFSNERTLSAELKNAYGISLKPGIFISNNLNVFVQAGFVYSQLQDIVYDKGLFNQPVDVSQVNFNDKNLYGYRLGAGAQYLLTKNLTAEIAWAISFYNDFTETEVTGVNSQGQVTSTGTIDFSSLRTNQVFLNLNYYFAQ